MLPRLVQHRQAISARLARFGADRFKRLASQALGFDQPIQRRDIGIVMLAMMQFQGFLAHAIGGKRSGGIGQRGQAEGHGGFSVP